MFKKTTNYFISFRISISLAILSEIFIQIGYFFYGLYKKTEVGVFFWTQCTTALNVHVTNKTGDKSELETCTKIYDLLRHIRILTMVLIEKSTQTIAYNYVHLYKKLKTNMENINRACLAN